MGTTDHPTEFRRREARPPTAPARAGTLYQRGRSVVGAVLRPRAPGPRERGDDEPARGARLPQRPARARGRGAPDSAARGQDHAMRSSPRTSGSTTRPPDAGTRRTSSGASGPSTRSLPTGAWSTSTKPRSPNTSRRGKRARAGAGPPRQRDDQPGARRSSGPCSGSPPAVRRCLHPPTITLLKEAAPRAGFFEPRAVCGGAPAASAGPPACGGPRLYLRLAHAG